jgi:hypothetical protein
LTEKPIEPDQGANPPPRGKSPWGLGLQLAALALAVVCAAGAAKLAHWLRAPGNAGAPKSSLKMPPRFFRGWDKPRPPDFVLVLTGQQHGYVLPCGCSRPQVGGLERRYNLVRLLKERGWPVVALDLGDVPQNQGPYKLPNVQGLIKYRYSMLALKEMVYAAVGIGEYEASLPLFNALGEFALQEHGNAAAPQTLVANLIDRENKFPAMLDSWRLVTAAGTKVGVTSVVGPSVAARIKDRDVKFPPTSGDTLRAVLKQMGDQQVQLPVLLYQGGSPDPLKVPKPTEAIACAEVFPQFPLILCLSESDEPPSKPREVAHRGRPSTLLLQVGHKGKNVGVLGVWRTGQANEPFKFLYEMVDLSEEFLTPEGEEGSNPVLALMETYTQELRGDLKAHPGGDYLSRYPQSRRHELQVLPPAGPQTPDDVVSYVGSQVCQKCHKDAYDIWKKSKHSHAYQTLVDAKRPALRQYDPECIVCHTVGFAQSGGFQDALHTPGLKNVGCESCHGPASLHVKYPNDPQWQARMNLLWKAPENEGPAQKATRMLKIDQFCQNCHDIDNDVTWKHDVKSGKGGFERKWPQVQHYRE